MIENRCRNSKRKVWIEHSRGIFMNGTKDLSYSENQHSLAIGFIVINHLEFGEVLNTLPKFMEGTRCQHLFLKLR